MLAPVGVVGGIEDVLPRGGQVGADGNPRCLGDSLASAVFSHHTGSTWGAAFSRFVDCSCSPPARPPEWRCAQITGRKSAPPAQQRPVVSQDDRTWYSPCVVVAHVASARWIQNCSSGARP